MSNHHVNDDIDHAVKYVQDHITKPPQIGLILGSGLGVLADQIEVESVIPYGNIPHFPVSTVEGHAGEFVFGQLGGQQVAAMRGRFHLYEGYDARQVTFPVRVMKQLGIHTLIVTNAAGGVNTSFQAGDLMLITDHLNLMYRNPLTGPNDERLGVRFPDMSEAYSLRLREVAVHVADRHKINLKQGVYAAVTGPTYETPAEVRMLRFLGADAVGMSTVPEVIAARHMNMSVIGISCITNMAAGILPQPLSHAEVVVAAEQARPQFVQLLLAIIEDMPTLIGGN